MMTDLAQLESDRGAIRLRTATPEDVGPIVALIAADQIAAAREAVGTGSPDPYLRAFAAIDADPAHVLVVGEHDSRVMATLQLSFLPGLARHGTLRAQIEAVRVHEAYRGLGIGEAMLRWAIDEAGRRGCSLVQLTSDKRRGDAHRLYERLGFSASHEGFKLRLGG